MSESDPKPQDAELERVMQVQSRMQQAQDKIYRARAFADCRNALIQAMLNLPLAVWEKHADNAKLVEDLTGDMLCALEERFPPRE